MSTWSKSFAKPDRLGMGINTGMSDGKGNPAISRVRYIDGRYWFCGAYEADLNTYWYLWTYAPNEGWKPVSWLKNGSKDGVSLGEGPDGRVNDFVFDDAGNLYVAGEFTRVRNIGGTEYLGVNALCRLSAAPAPHSPDVWQPVGTWQASGTVSHEGSIKCLAWHSPSQRLYIGGAFSGIPGKRCFDCVVFDAHTGLSHPLGKGVYGTPGNKHYMRDLVLVPGSGAHPDVIATGMWKFAGGAGYPAEDAWARTVARYDAAADDWKPLGESKLLDKVAPNYIQTGNPEGNSLALDNRGGLWVGGGFASSSRADLRGIARFDLASGAWSDPTGRGGFDRDVTQLVLSGDGSRMYAVGAFAAFADGTAAPGVACFDLDAGAWVPIAGGLSGYKMPGHMHACTGPTPSAIVFAGDFRNAGDAAVESNFVAEFDPQGSYADAPYRLAIKLKHPTAPGKKDGNLDIKPYPKGPKLTFSLGGAAPRPNALYVGSLAAGDFEVVVRDGASPDLSLALRLTVRGFDGCQERFAGNQGWSASYAKPSSSTAMKATTGMSDGVGAPDIRAMCVGPDGTVYFAGSWNPKMGAYWTIWSWSGKGWTALAHRKSQKAEQGPNGVVHGLMLHGGALYACGAFREAGNAETKQPSVAVEGVAILDLASGVWRPLAGTFAGKDVNGAVSRNGTVNALAVLPNGDILVGGSFAGLTEVDNKVKSFGIHRWCAASGAFEPMGKGVYTDPEKPNVVHCICVDGDAIYIGGAFVYAGGDGISHVKHRVNSIARWSAADSNWVSLGTPQGGGQMLDETQFVGLGTELPAKVVASGLPTARCMAMVNGKLLVGGAFQLRRLQAYCLAQWDPATGEWSDPTKGVQGVSRDVYALTPANGGVFVSGAFQMSGRLDVLNNCAWLDVATGALHALGGGLTGKTFPVVVCAAHPERKSTFFGGQFTHAGRAANLLVEKPNPSYYVAEWKW